MMLLTLTLARKKQHFMRSDHCKSIFSDNCFVTINKNVDI